MTTNDAMLLAFMLGVFALVMGTWLLLWLESLPQEQPPEEPRPTVHYPYSVAEEMAAKTPGFDELNPAQQQALVMQIRSQLTGGEM